MVGNLTSRVFPKYIKSYTELKPTIFISKENTTLPNLNTVPKGWYKLVPLYKYPLIIFNYISLKEQKEEST